MSELFPCRDFNHRYEKVVVSVDDKEPNYICSKCGHQAAATPEQVVQMTEEIRFLRAEVYSALQREAAR